MLEKIKNLWGILLGITVFVLMISIAIGFLEGGVWAFEAFYKYIEKINGFVFYFIIFLILLSVIPKIRIYTGAGIVYGTYLWGALFWLTSLYVTYTFWGFWGILIGIFLMGVGIFATAILALLFNGEGGTALIMLVSLIIIYAIRILGGWIITKYPEEAVMTE
ncbi:MAG: hypothetical protein M3Q24_01390 [bacterium]|nr:hypothetical protein [bacterium]